MLILKYSFSIFFPTFSRQHVQEFCAYSVLEIGVEVGEVINWLNCSEIPLHLLPLKTGLDDNERSCGKAIMSIQIHIFTSSSQCHQLQTYARNAAWLRNRKRIPKSKCDCTTLPSQRNNCYEKNLRKITLFYTNSSVMSCTMNNIVETASWFIKLK